MTQRRRLTRRRFLTLVAAGSAAAITSPARSIAAPARVKPVAPAPSPKVAKEIEKQKGYVADALKTIRAHKLPTGSNMAFVFQPLRPRRRPEARRAR